MVLESNTYIDISPYHEILSGMNFILSISVGVVKLTGPSGTGKTRLLQQLEHELLAERQETLLFLTPPTSIRDLHDTITRKLKLNNEFGFNKALIHHIVAKPYDQQRLVVAFDNAELIDIDVLLAIALFRNIVHNGQPIISIVLCGSDTLNAKLEDSSYRPLVEDMLLSYEIHPMTREQLQAYGHACADIHRLGKLPLKNGVLAELHEASKGLPGAVPDLLEKLRDRIASGAFEAKPEPVAAKIEAVAPAEPAAAPVTVAAAIPAEEPPVETQFTLIPKTETLVAKTETRSISRIFGKAPKPEKAAEVAPEPEVLPEAPVALPDIVADTEVDDPDARLIASSRAEAEQEATARFKLEIDWERWKPLMQRGAAVAGLVVVVVFAWPRLAPTLSSLYSSLSNPAPAPAPVRPEPTPVVPEPVEELIVDVEPASAAPAIAEPAIDEPTVEEPLITEAAPVETEAPAVAIAEAEPEPLVEPEPEPLAAPEPEPEPLVAVAEPAPAPAQTPAPQLTRVPGPTLTNASPDDLERVIREWLSAWQDQDVDDFFSYYHTDFAPLYQNTLAAWRADRQTKIARPASIMIELEDLMVGQSSQLGTRVSFWMTYESPTYADRTLKEVLLGQDVDGQWRILQEYNQQTTPLGPTTFATAARATQPGGQRTQIAANPTPPSAFPTRIQPPPVAARASFTQEQIDSIARFLAEWLTAWQNQDVDEYFRFYEPSYKPESMASTEQWRNDRIEKIQRPQRIVLRMDELEIVAGSADNVRVQLVLEYHSTHYADRTVKEIELRRATAGTWLIAEERNREVEPLPLMRLLPIGSLAFLVMNHR